MTCEITLNRFHRLSLWCDDCQTYWQIPNYLVVLHGTYDKDMIHGLLKINLYLYHKLFGLDINETFGPEYVFERELYVVFEKVKNEIRKVSDGGDKNGLGQLREIKILDIDIIAYMEQNMTSIIEFIMRTKGAFDTMASRIIENSSKSFINKLAMMKKNIVKSMQSDNIKCAIDNMMDLNIAGLDVLVQCVGIILNCCYVLLVQTTEPTVRRPGVMYCKDLSVIVERLANISAQNFLYRYKRRWLVYYREILSDCRSLFGTDLKTYDTLRTCGNYEKIESVLYNMLIIQNEKLKNQLTVLKHIDRYPKTPKDIYNWWSGRTKEELQTIYNTMDDCLGMDKKSTLLPFILTHKMLPKDRIFHDIFNMLKMFDRINPELSMAISFIVRIYPDVFEQVYFPDRENYAAATMSRHNDVLDNINNKETLRKCENIKCQERNNGKGVTWNLNTFEAGKYSMNTIFKELIKNPQIFEEIFTYAQKNFNIVVNSDAIVKKTKYIYK